MPGSNSLRLEFTDIDVKLRFNSVITWFDYFTCPFPDTTLELDGLSIDVVVDIDAKEDKWQLQVEPTITFTDATVSVDNFLVNFILK